MVRAAGRSRGAVHAAVPVYLARRQLAPLALPWLSGAGLRARRTADPTAFVVAYPEAVALAGETALQALAALSLAWSAWHRALGPTRSTSQLGALVDLATVRPLLTAAYAAEVLAHRKSPTPERPNRRPSLYPARRLLEEMHALGILVPVARFRVGRVYVTADRAAVGTVLRGQPQELLSVSASLMPERAPETPEPLRIEMRRETFRG